MPFRLNTTKHTGALRWLARASAAVAVFAAGAQQAHCYVSLLPDETDSNSIITTPDINVGFSASVDPLSAATATDPAAAPEDAWRPSWHLSTNLLAWSLAITNAMGEYDFGRHWSAGLSVYYSAWNYGKVTRKFRTFIFRPEVRYWFGAGHRGLFVDLHAEMAAFNFALPGWEYRIQDTKGHHPALGGGIGLGYRLPLGHSGRWSAEAAIGAGVYHLDYNRFVNEANGALVDRRERTFFGIDNAAITIVYNFNASGR